MATSPVELRERYVAALRQYAVTRREEGLGDAYALGRAAVASGLSVLDLAEAHHLGLREMLEAAETRAEREEIVSAAAEFHRESLSTFEIAHRGYLEVQEVARLEHDHVDQLRALSDASLSMASTLAPGDILDVAVSAARRLAGVERANAVVGAFGPERTTRWGRRSARSCSAPRGMGRPAPSTRAPRRDCPSSRAPTSRSS